MKTLNIIKPDDWHLHLREGLVLKNIIQFTSEYFGRAIVMPNTKSPITSINSAISYRKSIVEALPESSKFEPLMTIYSTFQRLEWLMTEWVRYSICAMTILLKAEHCLFVNH